MQKVDNDTVAFTINIPKYTMSKLVAFAQKRKSSVNVECIRSIERTLAVHDALEKENKKRHGRVNTDEKSGDALCESD